MFFRSEKNRQIEELEVEKDAVAVAEEETKPDIGLIDIRPIIDFIKSTAFVKVTPELYIPDMFSSIYGSERVTTVVFSDRVITLRTRITRWPCRASERDSSLIAIYASEPKDGQLELFGDNPSFGHTANIDCSDVSNSQFEELYILMDTLLRNELNRLKLEKYKSILEIFE